MCIFIFGLIQHYKRRQLNLQTDILAHYIADDDELEIYRCRNRSGFEEID